MQIDNCIILCGGKGTRIREYNSSNQKCLIQINGLPFIEYLLKQFSQFKITLCTGYLGNQIKDLYQNQKNIRVLQEHIPLGTGGAIVNSLKEINEELIIISNGDSFCDFNLNLAVKIFFEKEIDFLVVTTDNFNSHNDYGMIEADQNNIIKSFNEKPLDNYSDRLMNCGIYIIKKKIFNDYKVENISLEKEIIPKIITIYKSYSHNIHKKVYDIGTPDRIKIAEDFFKNYEKNR